MVRARDPAPSLPPPACVSCPAAAPRPLRPCPQPPQTPNPLPAHSPQTPESRAPLHLLPRPRPRLAGGPASPAPPVLPAVPKPPCPPPATQPRGGARHFAAAAAPGARGPLNCSQNGWRLDQLICKIGVNQLIRGPHAGRGAEAFAMQRGRGPRRVFIWGNGNQAAHKATPRAGLALGRPRAGSSAPVALT